MSATHYWNLVSFISSVRKFTYFTYSAGNHKARTFVWGPIEVYQRQLDWSVTKLDFVDLLI